MHISNLLKTFPYLGGKFSTLPWLLPHINIPCTHRIDVMGGSGVALFNCDQAPIETYNDINGKVVNFFKVLRDNPAEFIGLLELTPHSRREYSEAWFSEKDSDVEQARKFFIRCVQSIYAAGAQDKTKGWCSALIQSRCSISEKTNKWLRSVNNLYEVAERLKQIQIENKDFRYILKNYDSPGTVFYLDEPYDMTFRSSTKYEFEFANQDFLDMEYYAKRVKGKIIISGYETDFMKELLKDFSFYKGPLRKSSNSDKPAYECVWKNH